jgi:hypothetical protein
MDKSDISIELYCTLDGYRVVARSNETIVYARTFALRQVALAACKRLAKSLAAPPDSRNREPK